MQFHHQIHGGGSSVASFLTTAHSDEDVERIALSAARLEELRQVAKADGNLMEPMRAALKDKGNATRTVDYRYDHLDAANKYIVPSKVAASKTKTQNTSTSATAASAPKSSGTSAREQNLVLKWVEFRNLSAKKPSTLALKYYFGHPEIIPIEADTNLPYGIYSVTGSGPRKRSRPVTSASRTVRPLRADS